MSENRKARYWTGVLYPENMMPDWEERIGDIVGVPYAYCIHNKDRDAKSEHRKDHVHMILAFKNTTTYKHALGIFKQLTDPEKLNEAHKNGNKQFTAINTCQPANSIRHIYDYLIHDTETCRKQGKELYDKSERITGNNFDIGAYEQLSQEDKDRIFLELSDAIDEYDIQNYTDFYRFVRENYYSDSNYMSVLRSYSSHFSRMVKGNYHRWQRSLYLSGSYVSKGQLMDSGESENVHDCAENKGKVGLQHHAQHHASTTQICPICGSCEIKKSGKTPANTQRYECKACGKKWVK